MLTKDLKVCIQLPYLPEMSSRFKKEKNCFAFPMHRKSVLDHHSTGMISCRITAVGRPKYRRRASWNAHVQVVVVVVV